MKFLEKIRKIIKQAKCNHVTSDNYCGGGSVGPNVCDNYTTYYCMLCHKQITFLGRGLNNTFCQTKQSEQK